MTALGTFALTLAMAMGAYGTLAAFAGGRTVRLPLVRSAENSLLVNFGLLSIAAFALGRAFITRDFGIEYVASYSSNDLPFFYTLSAFWAGQKGSLLLWAWVLALFGGIVVLQNRRKHRELMPYVVGVVAIVLLFFEVLLVFVTPPFERLAFTPADGQGLNPMLQNPGMVFHPTTLYLGYIAFTVPFAFAMAALITGKLDSEWIRTTRRWTLFAWFFLTWGNLFGAQWAYVELGWGGFWMWDPVESASFMPWLTGTAFLHSVMIQEKRNMLRVWNMSLIVITFALTLFGTFLTRSGILSSVHTFSEVTLGPAFLGFIGAVLIFSVLLLVSRRSALRSANELDAFVSRESSFLFNNLLFVGIAFAVFWGTVFPLISEAVRGVKVTVGAPFFNQVTIPIFLGLLALTGICPLIAWRRASLDNLRRNFLRPAAIGVGAGVTLWLAGVRHPYALVSLTLGAFVLATLASEFYRGVRARRSITGKGWLRAFSDLVGRNRRRYGGYIVHFAVILFAVGVTGKAFVAERSAFMAVGDTLQVRDYTFIYRGQSAYPSRNRYVVAANLDVLKNGEPITTLQPQRRQYARSEQPTTEPDIRSTLREDVYAILNGFEEDRASIKVIINPLTAWLWISGIVLTIGTIIAIWPDKSRRRKEQRRPVRPASEKRVEPYATV